MSDKLKELTERLYNEGLSKGKQEGEKILEDAKAQAGAIIEAAKAEAEAILAKAEKDAADLRSKTESDVKMASSQALQATRKDIENIVIAKIGTEKATAAMKDPDFVKSLIKEVAAKFTSEQSADIALLLPASMQESLEPWVEGELAAVLGKGVDATFSKKIAGGFNIGPADGGWFVSLSDSAFEALVAEYLRPVTRKLLFG